jgi:hypothetical protein
MMAHNVALAFLGAVLVPGEAQVLSTQTVVVSTAKAGYTTYQVSVTFDRNVEDVYALYGEPDDGPSTSRALVIPPAFQVQTPFGSNVGPTNPAFFEVMPESEFDSFLTIGMDGPSVIPGAMSTIGLDFDNWTERTGIHCSDGAVFFMDPSHGATAEPVVFAQLTVRTGTHFTGQINAQGRSAVAGEEDWDAVGLQFSDASSDASAPAPSPTKLPPPPPPPSRPPPALPPPPPVTVGDAGGTDFVSPVTTTIGTSSVGTTIQLSLALGTRAESVYTIFGEYDSVMSMPGAYQAAAPFGVHIGGVSPQLTAVMPTAQYDSWLTIGSTDGSSSGSISSIGLDFESWTAAHGLSTDNGALFYMDPDAGPSQSAGYSNVVIAQLTLPKGAPSRVPAPSVAAQGRPMMHGVAGEHHPDWTQTNIVFSIPDPSGAVGGGH